MFDNLIFLFGLQARAMGIYAAHCIARSVELECSLQKRQRLRGDELDTIYGNNMLDLFAHITHFFDHKVVLLGRFNGQGLGAHLEKCTKDIIITAGVIIFQLLLLSHINRPICLYFRWSKVNPLSRKR